MLFRPLNKALTTEVSSSIPGNIPRNRASTSREEIKPICLVFWIPHLGRCLASPTSSHVLQEGEVTQQRSLLLQHMAFEERLRNQI